MPAQIAAIAPLQDATPFSWLVPAFLIGLVFPGEISPTLGDLVLPPYRILCIVAVGPLIAHFARANKLKWNTVDWLVVFFAFWTMVCHLANAELQQGLQAGGSSILDVVAYFIARAYVTSPQAMIAAARVTVGIVLLMVPFTVAEAVLHQHIVHAAFGGTGALVRTNDVRLGLLRASGPFEHPIMYGTFCASSLSASWFLLSGRTRLLRTGLIGLAVFVSVSSAPILVALMQVGLAVWDRSLRGLRAKWALLLSIVVAALLAAEIGSNRPMSHIIVSYLTLEPQSGWTRLAQWDFGWVDVENNWLFGLGFRDWARPVWLSSSVDSYWLNNGIKFGVVGLIAVASATVLAILAVLRSDIPPGSQKMSDARKAWMFTIVAIALVGATVDYWQQMNAYYFFLLGQGMWLTNLPRRSFVAALMQYQTIDPSTIVPVAKAAGVPASGPPHRGLPIGRRPTP